MVAFRVSPGGSAGPTAQPGRRARGKSVMIIAMNERTQRSWIALAGLGGSLLVAVAQSSHRGGFTPQVGVQDPDAYFGSELYTPLVAIAMTVLALGLVR